MLRPPLVDVESGLNDISTGRLVGFRGWELETVRRRRSTERTFSLVKVD